MGARILMTVLLTVLVTFQTLFADSTRDDDRCGRKSDERRIHRAATPSDTGVTLELAREEERRSDCGERREPSRPPVAIASR